MTMLLDAPTFAAAPEPAPPVENDLPLIDQAEALVLQLEGLLIQMTERDRNNLGQIADMMGVAAGRRHDLVADALEDMHAYMGPGNRVMDQIDRDEAEEAQERAKAATANAALAAGPLRVIENDEPQNAVRMLVLVRDCCPPSVWINTALVDRSSAEQWAREQVALGKVFDVSIVDED